MRVLVLSQDALGREMGGNAIRAYELARVLTAHASVALASPAIDGGAHELLARAAIEPFVFDPEQPRSLQAQLAGADVLLTPPQNPVINRQLARSRARVVYDLYDPKPLQLLEAFAGAHGVTRRYWSRIAADHVMEALRVGDYLLCASERQRDLWIGMMLAGGLITPSLYSRDPALRSLIDVVPFGVPAQPPHSGGDGPFELLAGLERDAELVLWNGGLWNWLDPAGAVEAMARVVQQRPRARLVFMGRAPLERHQAAAAAAARTRARELGLLERVVFFNERWVPYEQRAPWLLAAHCALSLHADHLETRFSFRTRLLDCLWAGLPVVCTAGDELAQLVAARALGASVVPGDADAAALAIVGVLESGRAAYAEALAGAAGEYAWPRVAAPLISYVCGDQARRPRRAAAFASPGRWARAGATRLLRASLRWLRRLS